ncbi:unnamed protein product [Xylocopa violacea]|uniref:Uncharacterized protein n=1 Tax=Xylocopa violacea TaxID=135666 RepID=A0ABP1NKD1_XYLVO
MPCLLPGIISSFLWILHFCRHVLSCGSPVEEVESQNSELSNRTPRRRRLSDGSTGGVILLKPFNPRIDVGLGKWRSTNHHPPNDYLLLSSERLVVLFDMESIIHRYPNGPFPCTPPTVCSDDATLVESLWENCVAMELRTLCLDQSLYMLQGKKSIFELVCCMHLTYNKIRSKSPSIVVVNAIHHLRTVHMEFNLYHILTIQPTRVKR